MNQGGLGGGRQGGVLNTLWVWVGLGAQTIYIYIRIHTRDHREKQGQSPLT